MKNALLQMVNIHKRFPGVYALNGVDFSLEKGEVHALVGENGAGKSTLINILGGIYKVDEGHIEIDGNTLEINHVMDARRAGISIIHQELVLVPDLSIAENIFLHREPTKYGMVDYKAMIESAQAFIDQLGITLDAKEKVSSLTIAQQQMVEIVRAISFSARIIVMDEPTSSLSDQEIDLLFESITKLKQRGISIIYISHRLQEIYQIADRVTILRDGKHIATKNISDISKDEIVSLMVGRTISSYYVKSHKTPGDIVLKVRNLSSQYVKDVSFDLRKGQIVGLAGLVGAGRTETVKAILGFDKINSGEIEVNGRPVTIDHPSSAYDLGIGFIPENRGAEAIFPTQSMGFNLSICVLDRFIQYLRVHSAVEQKLINSFIEALNIRTSSRLTEMRTLSGGNQQKVIVARWLATNPNILIMDEPTRGIDVGAKADIYALMDELVSQGIAILMISSELPEIINMSDTVLVMREGTISAVLENKDISQENIMKHAVHL